MCWLFLLAAGGQIFFWTYFLRCAFVVRQPLGATPVTAACAPVSVIVCFRNEAQHLEACLRDILRQDYPGHFEVVAVNDNSADRSGDIAREIAATDSRLRYLEPGPTRPGKKDALTFGIAQARHDRVLLTDADCVPGSTAWLRLMMAPLRKSSAVVLGFSPYRRRRAGSVLHAWQSYEAVYVGAKYLGFARRGLPYMGVGRNLAYTKEFFTRSGGLAAHAELAGGDDDLLIGENARGTATATVVTEEAWTWTQPSENWRAYFGQRRRHQSVGGRYQLRYQLWLGLLALSHGLFFLLGFCLLFSPHRWWALLVYAVRLAIVFNVTGTVLKKVWAGPDRENAPGKVVKEGFWVRGILQTALFDACVGPMYLYLAVANLRPRRRW